MEGAQFSLSFSAKGFALHAARQREVGPGDGLIAPRRHVMLVFARVQGELVSRYRLPSDASAGLRGVYAAMVPTCPRIDLNVGLEATQIQMPVDALALTQDPVI